LSVNFISETELEKLGAPPAVRVVHILGDSQALFYDGLIGKHEDRDGTITIYRFATHHCPRTGEPLVGERYQRFVRDDILNALVRVHAIRQNGLTNDTLVFSDGSAPMHDFLYARGIVNDFDFELPGNSVPRDTGRPIVPYSLVRQEVKQQTASLELGTFLKAMAGMNFPISFMIPPPPPHKSDFIINEPHERFRPEGRNFPVIPLLTRTKIHRLFISEVESICAGEGVETINLWNETTDSLALQQQYELDGAHPNRNFAMKVGARIIERMVEIEREKQDAS